MWFKLDTSFMYVGGSYFEVEEEVVIELVCCVD